MDYSQLVIRPIRKALWRLRANRSPHSTPVFICGVQRSGTTMLGKALDRSPEIRVLGETSPDAFENFMLRDDETVRRVVRSSPYTATVFKPLTDSHRLPELLDMFAASRGIWMYRWYGDRAKSAVARFGRHNLEVLAGLASGRGWDSWQAKGLDESDRQTIAGFDYSRLSPEAAACLFWCLRNTLYFKQNLTARPDVLLVSYDELVRAPESGMREISSFIRCGYDREMIARIHARSSTRVSGIDLPADLRRLCEEMYGRLEAARHARH